jgi:hypothetical protein
MIRSRFIRSSALVLSTVVALSCADNSPTELKAPTTAQHELLSGLSGTVGGLIQPVIKAVGFVADATGLTVHPIAWSDSRPKVSYSVSGTISPWGGTLTIPEADFTINFPVGAVSQPTDVTITSDPNFVAYQMEPHGIRFAKPVVVTQGLRNTAIYGQPLSAQLFGAYLANDLLDLGSLLNVDEIAASLTIFRGGSSLIPEISVWSIDHFSRYMLASG